MLIRVPIADLKFCLGIAFSATLTTKNRPVLNNVLLTIEGRFTMHDQPRKYSGTLSAHDGDITVSCALNSVQIEGRLAAEQMNLLLPPVVQSIINELPPMQTIEIQVDESNCQNVTLVGGLGRFRLYTTDPAEFPPVRVTPDFDPDITVDGALLQRAIARVVPVCDGNDTRFAMGCVLFDVPMTDDTLTLVATDGKRLVMNDLPAEFVKSGFNAAGGDLTSRWERVLLPAGAAKVLAKIAKDSPTVKLRSEKSSLLAEGLGIVVQCRLNDGRFPQYKKVIPQSAQVIELDTKLFLRSLRAAAATVDKEEDDATLTFSNNADGGNLHIDMDSSEGDASVDCPVPHPVEDFQTTLAAKYVTQALAAMSPEEPVELHTPADDGKAIRLHQVAAKFSAVIMPLGREEAQEAPKKK